MRKFLSQNTLLVGVTVTLASEALAAALVWLVLALLGQPVAGSVRWFALCFVPPALILRHYAKRRSQSLATRGTTATLFVTFIAFMWLFVKHGGLS